MQAAQGRVTHPHSRQHRSCPTSGSRGSARCPPPARSLPPSPKTCTCKVLGVLRCCQGLPPHQPRAAAHAAWIPAQRRRALFPCWPLRRCAGCARWQWAHQPTPTSLSPGLCCLTTTRSSSPSAAGASICNVACEPRAKPAVVDSRRSRCILCAAGHGSHSTPASMLQR